MENAFTVKDKVILARWIAISSFAYESPKQLESPQPNTNASEKQLAWRTKSDNGVNEKRVGTENVLDQRE